MFSALKACVCFLSMSVVTGYGSKGHFNNVQVFPVMPPQPPMLPQQPPMLPPQPPMLPPHDILGVFPMYQNNAPLMPGPPMWQNMNSQWMPFFYPPGCEIEYPHHNSLHGSPFLNPNQWSQIPFQGQGQWKQPNFQNQDKGQWKQTAFSSQGQNQWKQPLTWNAKQNVNMIGQWDRFPVNDKMISQPAISRLIPKETGFNVPLTRPKPRPQPGFEAPVQSRRLR